jgi:hypothetical protein
MEKDSVKSTVVDVIDLESSFTNCAAVPAFPNKTYGAFGGLGIDSCPIICGGYQWSMSNKCFSFRNGDWSSALSLTQAKRYAASVTTSNSLYSLITTGTWCMTHCRRKKVMAQLIQKKMTSQNDKHSSLNFNTQFD